MDNSIDDSLGEGESSVESTDRGRGLEDKEGEHEEPPGLSCAIPTSICYCGSQELWRISALGKWPIKV